MYESGQIVNLGVQEGQELVVRDIIDLKGGIVKLPAGVLITFNKGGSIVNGTLIGNETRIKSIHEEVLGAKLNGTWLVDKIKDVAFSKDYLSDGDIINNLNIIQSDSILNEIIIDRDYRVAIPRNNGYGLMLSSNSKLFLNATLTVEPNSYTHYKVIFIPRKQNVCIVGGRIVGDVGLHTYVDNSTSEWGMGIYIDESSGVVVEDTYISRCIGDGVYVTGGNESALCLYNHASKDVLLKRVICDDNRRQGLSVIHVDGLTVVSSKFINTGKTERTNPSSGVDLEPNVMDGKNLSIKNISFSNCELFGNKGIAQLGSGNAFYNGHNSSFENIRFEKTMIDGLCYIAGDMDFFNCKIKSVTVRNSEIPVHVSFQKCTISEGDGICVMVQQPWSKYKKYEKNRDYSILFENCFISVDENYYDKDRNGLFFYKSRQNSYDGRLILHGCTVTLPRSSNPDLHLFKRNIPGVVVFENTIINSNGRPLDLGGASYKNCVINCDYLLLNAVRYGKDVLRDCRINTTSEEQIIFISDNGVKGDGFDIQNCIFKNRTAPAFKVQKNSSLKNWGLFIGNKIANDNSSSLH